MGSNAAKLLGLVLFIVFSAVAVWMIGRPTVSPENRPVKPGERTIIDANNDYTKVPVNEQSQECDPLVIDAWKRLNKLHGEFFERFNTASPEEKKAMQGEFMALFFNYEPVKGKELPKEEDDDTPEDRSKKRIMRVGWMFEEAIRQNPGNASNYVSYAIFLKPRNEGLAYDNFKQGIKMWPKNQAFRFLLVDFLYQSPKSHGFVILRDETPAERRRKYQREIFTELEQIHKLDSDNAFVWIYTAQVRISLGQDAVMIYEDFKRASECAPTGHFLQPPPRPAKSTNWYNAANLRTRSTNLHFEIERNYGYYMNTTIERYITKGGLREAAERIGPSVFPTMFVVLYRMARTDPFDRTFFYLAYLIADTMKEYYAENGKPEAAAACNKIKTATEGIEREIRNVFRESEDWNKRIPEGLNPFSSESIPLRDLERHLRRNNHPLYKFAEKYAVRYGRDSTDIVEKYPVEPKPDAKGKFWHPTATEAATDEVPEAFAENEPVNPEEVPAKENLKSETEATSDDANEEASSDDAAAGG